MACIWIGFALALGRVVRLRYMPESYSPLPEELEHMEQKKLGLQPESPEPIDSHPSAPSWLTGTDLEDDELERELAELVAATTSSDPARAELSPLENKEEGVHAINSRLDLVIDQLSREGRGFERVTTGIESAPEILILEPAHTDSQPTIRLYRGVNQLSLQQDVYAMRQMTSEGIVIRQDWEEAVQRLSAEPTYRNLVDYRDLVESSTDTADPEQVRQLASLDADVARLEDLVIDGDDFREWLAFMTIERGGGVMDAHLAPFLSASHNPAEALRYQQNGGLLVLEIPIDRVANLEGFASHGEFSEAMISGGVGPEDVSAVIPFSRARDGMAYDLQPLDAVLELLPPPKATTDQLQQAARSEVDQWQQFDQEHQAENRRFIFERRAQQLIVEHETALVQADDFQDLEGEEQYQYAMESIDAAYRRHIIEIQVLLAQERLRRDNLDGESRGWQLDSNLEKLYMQSAQQVHVPESPLSPGSLNDLWRILEGRRSSLERLRSSVEG